MTKIRTSLRTRVAGIALFATIGFSLPAAYAAPAATLKVCINKVTGAALVKSACASSEIAFSEQSYSASRDRILYVAKKGAKYKTIKAAVDATVTLRPSAASPVVVRVAPGTYTLSGGVTIPGYVTVEGAGREATTIKTSTTSGIFLGSNSALRALTVESTLNVDGRSVIQTAPGTTSITLENLGVSVSGAFWIQSAIILTEGDNTVRNVRITGPANSAGGTGITALGGTVKVENCEIDLAGITTGLSINSASEVTVRSTTITLSALRSAEQATGISVGGATTKFFGEGLKIKVDTTLGGANNAVYVSGIVNDVTILNSSLDSIGATAGTIEVAGGGTAQVLNSKLTASGTNPPAGAIEASALKIAGTLLSGGSAFVDGGATVTCAGVYDENFVFSASSCP